MDLRQHLDSTFSAQDVRQHLDRRHEQHATIRAVRTGMHASTPALARAHARRHVIPDTPIDAATRSRLDVIQRATAAPPWLSRYRIPARGTRPRPRNVDMDADDDVVETSPPIQFPSSSMLAEEALRERMAARRALAYQLTPRERALAFQSAPPSRRSQSVGRTALRAELASQAAPVPPAQAAPAQAAPEQESDSDIEIYDPDVQIRCEDDTGEARHD